MNYQNKAVNGQQTNQPAKKKRGCLFGCLVYVFLPLFLITASLFVVKTVLRNKEEKVAQHLNARFIYEGDDSSENKLNTAFEKGEISTDDYVLQMAYSLYEPDKLAPSYQSNNAVALAPDIAGLFCEHIDELSDETAEYIARKIMLTDVRIHPDASQNPVAPKQGWLPFVTHAYADGYDVTVLDRACLSPNGKFLIWYTLTGESAVTQDVVVNLAATVETIAEQIEGFLSIQWDYEFSKNEYKKDNLIEVLEACGINEDALDSALPIYLYEPPNNDGAMAWYLKDLSWGQKTVINLTKPFLPEDTVKELNSAYSIPYIVIKTSSIRDTENLNTIFAHELTHHFQQLYYDDKSFSASGYTSETVANYTAASIAQNIGTNTLLNSHANQYVEIADSQLGSMEFTSTNGYLEFLWAKSYADIVKNGIQYLKESLQKETPYKFLCEKAGDDYYRVLEDLAARNITKDYVQKAFVSNIFPKESDEINPYMDTVNGSFYANCFDYYYLDCKLYQKAKTILALKNTGETKIFVQVIGRKKDAYSLIKTLYCEPNSELELSNFVVDYKNYDEVILALGHCETKNWGYYEIASLSEAALDFYETMTGLKELNPLDANGDCMTIYVDDLLKSTEDLAGFLRRMLQFTGDNLGDNNDETKPSEEQQLLLEVLDSYDSEIARLLEGVKEFRKAFDYKIIRIYTIPVNNSTLSSDVFMIGICFCHNQSNTLKLTVKNTKKRLIHIISTVLYE